MTVKGRVARIDVWSASVAMDSGAGIGNTIQSVTRLYAGRVKIEPHLYTGPVGKYLTVMSADRVHGVRFEINALSGLVDVFYVGKVPEIHFPEGCL